MKNPIYKEIDEQVHLIRIFVQGDFVHALEAFHKASKISNDFSGFYSLLRILFPVIDHVAQLVTGSTDSTTFSLKKYFSDYLSKVNPKYEEYSEVFVVIFRHGLLHQLQPKIANYQNIILEWELFYREEAFDHLSSKNIENGRRRICIDVEQFAKDFMLSVENYKEALKSDKRLLENFIQASELMEMRKKIK